MGDYLLAVWYVPKTNFMAIVPTAAPKITSLMPINSTRLEPRQFVKRPLTCHSTTVL